MALSDQAFKTAFKPYYKVVILGETIDSELIKSVSPLNAELDYPDLTTFNIGNVHITLFDPDGEFNPNNTQNFWTAHWSRADVLAHYNQVGYKGSVEIHLGYDNDGTIESEKLFDGEVTNIRVNLQPPEVVITAVDTSQNLRPSRVEDFGIEREVILPVDSEVTNFGRYPFPPQSIPSEKSVSALANISKDPMTDVGSIRTEGALSSLNYQVANNAIETEGGQLPDADLPVATYKDAYRYKRIETLITELLDAYDISDREIEILPTAAEEAHFASYGRPGLELQNLPADLLRQWHLNGYVKDVVYDSTNKKYYMLYGQRSPQLPDYIISCFNSLQTGKTFRTRMRMQSGLTASRVSIPFKRERLSELMTFNHTKFRQHWFQFPSNGKDFPNGKESGLLPMTPEMAFQFPSNGKDFPNSARASMLKRVSPSFNSLQTGKTFRTEIIIKLERDYYTFQFPSNGKDFPN